MENKFYMVTVNIFVFDILDEDDIETKDRSYLCGIFPEIKEAEKYCKELFEKWGLHADDICRNSYGESKMHIVDSKNKTKYCICHEEFELTDRECVYADITFYIKEVTESVKTEHLFLGVKRP